MLNKLQQKWGVGLLQTILILITFTIGGSLTGYLGKWVLGFFSIGSKPLWVITYLIIVTLIWPIMVLLISIPFGQFAFFKNYLKRIAARLKKSK